jgi:hypothetical protein
LIKKGVNATELACGYTTFSLHLWPEFQRCQVSNKEFPSTARSEKFTFSDSTVEKNETTAIWFYLSPSIEFIPLQIFNEFPNLNGLLVSDSNIPTLKENFYTKDFKDILYLYLGSNKISQIDEYALIN